MTCKESSALDREPPADSEGGREVPPKATLFCPDCGHSSQVRGDWDVLRVGATARYRCPDCRATVTERPAEARGPPGPWGAWLEHMDSVRTRWWRAVLP